MKKRVVSIILVIVICLSLVGCFNYREINKLTFATSIVFDKDENDRVIVYVDCVRPYRNASDSSDKGRRLIYKGVGKTSLEAIRDIDIGSSNKLNFGQVRAYIFTENAARDGVKKYLDLINNGQEFSYKPYMFVYFGEVDSLVNLTTGDEEYLGLYLNDLVEKNKDNSKVIHSNVNDYISQSYTKGNVGFMTAIKVKEDGKEKRIELDGGVILKNNFLVKKIEPKDALEYNLAKDNVKEGTFEVSNPEEKDTYITLDILENKAITKIYYEGEDIKIIKNINTTVSIGEIQGHLIMNNDYIEMIKKVEEEKIKNNVASMFKENKEKNIDIFGIERLLEEKYPGCTIENPLEKSTLEVQVKVHIDGSGLVRDSI